MKYFDCHCDTLTKMFDKNKGFYNNGFDCDRSLLKSGDEAHIVYAVFNDGSLFRKDMLSIFDFFKEKSCQIKNGAAYLSVEGLGNQPDFCIDDVALYRRAGVRMMSLTWNNDNPLCGGIENNASGLSADGKAVLREMVLNKIIPDVSHASDKGCYDIIEQSGVSVCASHSNSRYVYQNRRNLTDDAFKMIAESGGAAGINLYADFLGENADINSVIKHIEHFLSLGGENNIGLGTDFDGMDKKPPNVENCGFLYRIYDELLAKGHNESFIKRLFFENFSEIFQKYE